MKCLTSSDVEVTIVINSKWQRMRQYHPCQCIRGLLLVRIGTQTSDWLQPLEAGVSWQLRQCQEPPEPGARPVASGHHTLTHTSWGWWPGDRARVTMTFTLFSTGHVDQLNDTVKSDFKAVMLFSLMWGQSCDPDLEWSEEGPQGCYWGRLTQWTQIQTASLINDDVANLQKLNNALALSQMWWWCCCFV